MPVRFLAHMNISPQTVTALQENGWDTVRVSQVLPVDAADEMILERARQDNRVVITQDLDFSALLALSNYRSPSLVTLRLSVSDPDTISETLLSLLPKIEDDLQRGCAITVDDAAVRKRTLPIQ